MRAVIIRESGGPEVLKIEHVPTPRAAGDQVLVRVRAFGINRSELFTRRGDSSEVSFPRIPGLEAVGTVEAAPSAEFTEGVKVVTAMGGMGRSFDGGYADFVLVPSEQVVAVRTNLAWEELGALPEMVQTAWGSLFRSLQLENGDRLLIRGGITSVGLAAAALAKRAGAIETATTRSKDREQVLLENGADRVLVDDGQIAEMIRSKQMEPFDKVLELIGPPTLKDSLGAAAHNAVVCLTGVVGHVWSIKDADLMQLIPTGVNLTTYSGGVDDLKGLPFQELVDEIETGCLSIRVGPTFAFENFVKAHDCMEHNQALGKIVVLI
jgi:NADPH:quinone reductase-like Zn-dependent oxidoreductase